MNSFFKSRASTVLLGFLLIVLAGFLFYTFSPTHPLLEKMKLMESDQDAASMQLNDTLRIITPPEYFPKETIDQFETNFNTVVEIQIYHDQKELYSKIEEESYDIAIVVDYLVEPMTEQGLLKRINHNYLKNFIEIDARFRELDYDYGNQYSIPFVWGTVGLSYNKKYVLGLPFSWDAILHPDHVNYLSGKISLLTDHRVTLGVLLMNNGYDPNSTNEEEVQQATNQLVNLIPHIVYDQIEEVEQMMMDEDLYISMMWSGNASKLSSTNTNIRYSLPSEGTIFWVDNMVILDKMDNLLLTYSFIDYLLEPEVIAEITNTFYEANPVTYSRRYIEPRILKGPSYSNPYLSDTFHMIQDLGDFDSVYEEHWDYFIDSLERYQDLSTVNSGLSPN